MTLVYREECYVQSPCLNDVMNLLANCHLLYDIASDRNRRLLNQALFDKIFVDEDGVTVQLAQPFASIVDAEVDRVQTALSSTPRGAAERRYIASHLEKHKNQKPAPSVAGLKDTSLVRPAGFEPTTPWFEAKYSNPLSYGRLLGDKPSVFLIAPAVRIDLTTRTALFLGSRPVVEANAYSITDGKVCWNIAGKTTEFVDKNCHMRYYRL